MANAPATDPSRPRLRALVLAAGHGMRLRPLTETLPKPLLPVLGREVAAHTFEELAAVGCEAVALNLHHLGDAIEERFGESYAGMPLHYSREPELLGTLGALAPLAEFFAEADLALIVNGDSSCRWPLAKLLKRHRDRRARATFLLARRADPDRFGGGVGVGKQGRLVSFRESGPTAAGEAAANRRYVFAGAHVVDASLLRDIEERPSDIVRELYEPLLEEGELLSTLVTGRRWHDLGTPERYRSGLVDLVRRGNWFSESAQVHPTAKIKRCVVEAGAVIEPGARLDRTVVLSGARVGAGARLSRSLLSFDTHLPAEAGVEGRMVWTPREGQAAGTDDSILAGLAYRQLT